MSSDQRRSVVVTGASTGIGRATAVRLATAGWRVFAGVRREGDAADLETEGVGIEPVMLDVTDGDQIAAASERVGTSLDGLVNNAGFAVPGPVEMVPIEDLRNQIEVNLIGQVAVAQALMEPIRAASGRVVNVTSIGGRVALPMFGPYHASKFGLEAITDSMRAELRPWGVDVIAVEPGSVRTEIWDRGSAIGREIRSKLPPRALELYGDAIEAGLASAKSTGERGIKPERVAAVIEKALTARRPRTRYLVGADARVMLAMRRLLTDRGWDRLVARLG